MFLTNALYSACGPWRRVSAIPTEFDKHSVGIATKNDGSMRYLSSSEMRKICQRLNCWTGTRTYMEKIHEVESIKKLELPPFKNKHDHYPFHNALNPHGELALPQFKSKRTPYSSHLDSYQIHNLLNPTRGIRDEMARKGITPPNHHKANIAAIAMRSAKLHDIRTGVTSDEKTNGTRNSKSRFIEMNGDRCETPDNASTTTTITQQSQTKKNPSKINFMIKNIEGLADVVAASKKKMSSNAIKQELAHENYGKVPAYLLRRKLELAQDRDRRIQEEKEKHLPPGLVLMDNDERLEVLKTLENNKEKLISKLAAMPLVLETPTQVRGKIDVDAQLKEVEESIKRFSRPKVYIRYDN